MTEITRKGKFTYKMKGNHLGKRKRIGITPPTIKARFKRLVNIGFIKNSFNLRFYS